jgi:hypothetical protein
VRREANILDPIHDTLDERVFDNVDSPRPKLKPEHREWVRDTIRQTLEAHGYTNVEEWLKLVLTGSLTTYQYSEESDFDVSLFVDTEVFPEWSRAEMIGIMIDNIDGTFLPSTPFVMQAFVVPPERKPEDLYQPGLRSGYDLDADNWVVPPERDRVHDVKSEMNRAYVTALESADKMERLLRYEPDKAVNYWHQIHKRRRRDQIAGKGDYADSNIVYKFLANRGLFPQISEVSGEYIARTATDWTEYYNEIEHDMEGFEPEVPWTTGRPGKCFMGDDGNVYSWNTDAPPDMPSVGVPHHTYMLEHFGLKGMKGSGWIYPDGRVLFPYLDSEPADEYTLEAIINTLPGTTRIEQAPKTAHGYQRSWALDGPAIRRAQKDLGITKPVEVKVVDGTNGYYTDMGDHHEVGVVGWLKPQSASTQLWHELQHCKQVEDTGPLPARPEDHDEYRAMPTEQEAREVAQNAAYPLVQPIQGPRVAAPNKKLLTQVQKWVYNGDTDELVIGELGPEEGVLPSHNQLAQEFSTDDLSNMVAGTISRSGYAAFEGGTGDHGTRARAQQAIKRAIPNLKGWLGGHIDSNPWDFSAASQSNEGRRL